MSRERPTFDEAFWQQPVYGLDQTSKAGWLLPRLYQLHSWHLQQCPAYQQLQRRFVVEQPGKPVPWQAWHDCIPLHVRLFKEYELRSVPAEQVIKVLTSSGTSSAKVSRILLDSETASAQAKALVRIMQHWLGKERLPMLIIDHPNVIRDRASFSARGAGIQGMQIFGRQLCYALNDDLSPNWPALDDWLARHQGGPILVFGFTFMVWQWLQALAQQGRQLDLSQGVLVHGGGWKKLQQLAVNNQQFKQQVRQLTGMARVHNFYGMVEQVGSVFVECEHGHLHSPAFAEVVIRRAGDLAPLPVGEEGVIQVLSALPLSYPGHSILTEDRGRILGQDDCPCGRPGRYFSVLGRVARAEQRGCSDTVAVTAGEQHAVAL